MLIIKRSKLERQILESSVLNLFNQNKKPAEIAEILSQPYPEIYYLLNKNGLVGSATVQKNCLYCGAQIDRPGYPKKYCSERCRGKADYENKLADGRVKVNYRRKGKNELVCQKCGRLFLSYNENQKFCSSDCSNDKTCRNCNKQYVGHPGSKYCCEKCKKEWTKNNPRHSRICTQCGKAFKTNIVKQTMCSNECCIDSLRIWDKASCIICGKEFKTASKNKQNKACSKSCGQKHRTLTKERECKWCKQIYTWENNQVRHQNYCSDDCKHKNKLSKKGKSCKWCGKISLRVFCTDDCKKQHDNERARQKAMSLHIQQEIEIKCAWCGELFEPSYGEKNRTYCLDCSKRAPRKIAKQKRRMRIKDKYVEPVPLKYLIKRDNAICKICGEKVNVEEVVPHPLAPTNDHIIPISLGGEHSKRNCQLAHFSCNCLKSNGVASGGEQLMLFG